MENGCRESRVLVIACGALAREVLALIGANRLSWVKLRCLPADLHLRPERITDAVREVIERHRKDFQRIFVLYGDCGTGGRLDALLAEEGIERLAGPHCYAFFSGNAAFAEMSGEEITTFYLTDFLVRNFENFVIRPLGIDRWPELAESFFGRYENLVYLAQSDDPALDRQAKRAAERLGLAYRRRPTGLGDLARLFETRIAASR